jgi:hypothetical protein
MDKLVIFDEKKEQSLAHSLQEQASQHVLDLESLPSERIRSVPDDTEKNSKTIFGQTLCKGDLLRRNLHRTGLKKYKEDEATFAKFEGGANSSKQSKKKDRMKKVETADIIKNGVDKLSSSSSHTAKGNGKANGDNKNSLSSSVVSGSSKSSDNLELEKSKEFKKS